MAVALPEGPRGRLMALAVTAAGLMIVWLGVVEPLTAAFADGQDSLERKSGIARRYEALSASLPILQRQMQVRAEEAAPAPTTLEGASDALAGASLQSALEGMAAAAGARLTSTETLPAEAVGGFRRISVRLNVDAGWPVLIKLLDAISKAEPRMFVDDVQIHAQPTAERTREPPLDIALTVLAFRAEAPPSPAVPGGAPKAAAQSAPPQADDGAQ